MIDQVVSLNFVIYSGLVVLLALGVLILERLVFRKGGLFGGKQK